MEGGMDIEITYPDSVFVGRDFTISFFVQNNGWENKEQVIFSFSSEDTVIPIGENQIKIDKISAGGSYGDIAEFTILSNASIGQHFLNLEYTQTLLENNEIPRDPTYTNMAIPINIKDRAKVIIHTITPESIFSQAEFPFTVEILSEDIDLKDLRIELIPPKDIEFRGETLHTFSSLDKGDPLRITSRIITPPEELQIEYKIPFQILVSYVNDIDEEETNSKTVSLVLRPRTFMELTMDGGIWIGGFFIAPYISLGTIIGIPVGALFSLLLRRSKKKKRKKNKVRLV
jgi:hypothetical protein